MPQDMVPAQGAGNPAPSADPSDETPILVPGKTCWRIARAHRFALIVDAADYFRTAQRAMEAARESIMAVGWDFDLRINLRPDLEGPENTGRSRYRLGDLIQRIVAKNRRLHAYILKWDIAMLQTITTQIVPLMALHWLTTSRIHFRLDSNHPLGASHHQKILVIDDSLAFCGGIDMTHDRWDTRDHTPGDTRRRRPDGSPYGPFHDVTTACDGPAAEALGEVVRRRWRHSGGGSIKRVRQRRAVWPEGLNVTMRDVDVAVARTEPSYNGREEVREIEALYLAVIRRAKRTLYLESQYFASSVIRDAIAERLREPDGPEIVVINPLSAASWLEEQAMDRARAHAVNILKEADQHGRFRIYYPVNAIGTPIYVHAKVVVMDERLLRIGSSNLNNRSMGFDTECDIALEAVPGSPNQKELSATILRFRNDLLAEHLGVDSQEVERALVEHGSLVLAIDALRRSEGRTLLELETRPIGEAELAVLQTHMMDPERPGQGERRLAHLLKRSVARLRPGRAAFLAGTVATGYLLGRRYRRDIRRARR